MRNRDELVHEAAELLVLYRDLAAKRTAQSPSGLEGMEAAIGRALEALDLHETKAILDSAAVQLAAVRDTLTRIRRTLPL